MTMTTHPAETPLDPCHSLVDYARLAARLAEPFARPDEVLATAFVTAQTLELAAAQWLERFQRDSESAALFARAFRAERALTGQPAKPPPALPMVVGVQTASDHAAGVGAVAAALATMDETAFAPLPNLGVPVLPFQAGAFEPPVAAAVIATAREPFDPDTTLAPALNADETLPFVKQLPSATLTRRNK